MNFDINSMINGKKPKNNKIFIVAGIVVLVIVLIVAAIMFLPGEKEVIDETPEVVLSADEIAKKEKTDVITQGFSIGAAKEAVIKKVGAKEEHIGKNYVINPNYTRIGKYDFLTAYICLLRDKFDHQIWRPEQKNITPDYFVSYAKQLIIFISDHSEAIDNICNSILFSAVLSIITEQNYKDTCERLEVSVKQGLKLTAPVDVVASMITGAVTGAVYQWLMTGRKSTPDELSDQVGGVIESIINHKDN